MATKVEKSYVGQRIHAVEVKEGRYAVPENDQHDLQALLVRAQLEV